MGDAPTESLPKFGRDWSALFDEHAPALLLYARQWTESQTDAEDAVQEGFVRFWQTARATGRVDIPLLFTMVKRKAIDLGRSRKRRVTREERAGTELYAEPAMFELRVEQDERRAAIEAALRQIPAEQREVLIMKIWGELTFAQIGESLGISLNTAASRYRYGLEAMRGILPAEGQAMVRP